MKKNLIIGSMMALGLLASGFAFSATTMDPAQKKQMETVVHDYLINNPEVVVQSLQSYQQKQMADTQKTFEKIQNAAPKYADKLFHQANDPVAGNPKGTVTLVEFFDYQCPHCVDMTPVIESLIKNNSNLRVVFKEFPIRGPISEYASRAALAANIQGKYFEFHKGLMESKTEPLTEEAIITIAKNAGLNTDKLKADMKNSVVDQQLKTNYQLAKDMQLMFTPVFFVGKSTVNTGSSPKEIVLIPGQVNEAQLGDVIKHLN